MAEVNINTNEPNTDPAQNQTEPVNQTANETDNNESANDPQDVAELVKRIAELEVTNKRYKASIDKSRSENKKLTEQLRARMSVDEQAEIDRKEAEEEQKEYIKSLENFVNVAKARARYALQGMDPEMAEQAAEAEISGDMDALASIQKKYTEQALKKAEAEWIKSRPQVSAGGNGSVNVTQEQFNAMGIQERTKLFREHPDVYNALLKK
jgi:hypothetical protein